MEKYNTSVPPGIKADGRPPSAARFQRTSSVSEKGATSTSAVEDASIGLTDLIDRLVPIDAKARRWKHAQGHRVVKATLFLMACSLLFATMDLMRAIPDFLLLGLVAGTLFGAVILIVLRVTGSPRLAGHLLCGGFFLVLVYQAMMDTGLTNPAVAPTLLLPWVASYTLGATAALLYAGLAAGLYLWLYALYLQGYVFPFVAPPDDVHVFLLVVYVIMVIVIAGIGYLYEQRRREAFTRRRRAAANGKAHARENNGLRPEVLSQLVQNLRVPLLNMVGVGTTLKSREDGTIAHGELIVQDGDQALELLQAADELAWLAQADNQPSLEHVEITAAVERALAPLREVAREKDITLWIESDDEAHSVKTDPQMMRSLIARLATCAIAHAREGRITVVVDVDEILRLRVKTAGAHETAPLAQPAAANGSFGHPAASLDLAIAEQLASKMNGRLDVSYAPDNGSVFSIVLPVE